VCRNLAIFFSLIYSNKIIENLKNHVILAFFKFIISLFGRKKFADIKGNKEKGWMGDPTIFESPTT